MIVYVYGTCVCPHTCAGVYLYACVGQMWTLSVFSPLLRQNLMSLKSLTCLDHVNSKLLGPSCLPHKWM